jgi:hypothetical protein
MEPTGRANARPMINSAKSGFTVRNPEIIGLRIAGSPDFASLHPGYGFCDEPDMKSTPAIRPDS